MRCSINHQLKTPQGSFAESRLKWPAICLATLWLSLIPVHARIVTLTTVATNDGTEASVEFTIGAYEVAELVSFPSAINGASPFGFIDIIKDGNTMNYYIRDPQAFGNAGIRSLLDPLIVAGPATLRLRTASTVPALCTFKVTPESFPPDRTIIVPPGPGGAVVTLECSTNLVDWVPAPSGAYTNQSVAKFFRIKLDRAP